MAGQAVKHLRHLAADFARADHVDVEVAKVRLVRGQRAAEGRAAFHVFQHFFQHGAHAGLVAHVDEHAQRGIERQPGAQHDGQLAGEREHVGGLDGAARGARARAGQRRAFGLAGRLHAYGRQPPLAQLAQHIGFGGGFGAAFGGLAVGMGGAPEKFRHLRLPGCLA